MEPGAFTLPYRTPDTQPHGGPADRSGSGAAAWSRRDPATRAHRGAVALRPLGAAEVLDGAVRIVRRNPRAAFGFALPVAVVQAVLAALILTASYSTPGVSGIATFLRLGVSLAAGVLLAGLSAPVVVSDALGTPISAGEAWRRARGMTGMVLLLVLAVGVAVAETVGVVAAVIGGVWLWGVWAVAGPALTIEQLGPIAALRRSFRLAGRCFWRAWGVRALGWVVTRVLSLLITLPFTAIATYVGRIGFGQTTGDIRHPAVFITVTTLGQLLAVALIAPIAAAIDGLIYLDLRMRVEGLDLVVSAGPTRAPAAGATAVTAW